MPLMTDTGKRAGLNIYLFVLALVCLLPVVTISGIAVWRAGQAYKATATARLSDTARTLASAIEAEIEGRFTSLSAFSTLSPLTAQTDSIDLTASRFEGIGLDGKVELVTLNHGVPQDGDRDERKAPVLEVAMQAIRTDAPAISNLYLGPTRKDHRIYLALPEASGSRAIVLAITPDQVIRTLQLRNEVLGTILVAVTDGNGTIVARSRDASRVVGMKAPDWDKLMALGTDSGWFEAVTAEGNHTVLFFQKLNWTPGWTVVVGEPIEVFNARWKDPLLGLALGAVFALATAILAAVQIGRLILRPVEALVQHSRAVASGQPLEGAPPIPASPVREFETLRRSVEAAEQTRREEDRRVRTVAHAGALVLWRWNEERHLVWVEGWEKQTGTPDGEALGIGWLRRVHPDDRQRVVDAFTEQVRKRALIDFEFRLLTPGDRWLWVRGRGAPVFDDAGNVVEWVGTLEDIDARKQVEAHIAHMALHDALTGLGNRVLLRECLEQTVRRAGRGEPGALLMLDLDRFKPVNDTMGHAVGDALLRAVASRLRSCTRDGDLVARIGGDEFAIIQMGAAQPQSAAALAHRLVEAISAPYEIDGHIVTIGTSVGITCITSGDIGVDEYLLQADKALYYAKHDGRGRAAFYEEPHLAEELRTLLAKFDTLKLLTRDAA